MPHVETPSGPVPLAVTTGSLYPTPTSESIAALQTVGLPRIELTLQANEFALTFDRKLHFPLLFRLEAQVHAGTLRVGSLHAAHMHGEYAHSTRARLELLAHTIEVACRLNAPVIVVHPFHLFTSHEAADSALKASRPALKDALLPGALDLFAKASDSGITLGVENVQVWRDDHAQFFNHPANLARFITEVDHPALSVTLDLVHTWFTGDMLPFIRDLEAHITNLHVADVAENGEQVTLHSITRALPGEGLLPWSDVLPALARLPRLRQVTLELARTTPEGIVRAAKWLACEWSAAGKLLAASKS